MSLRSRYLGIAARVDALTLRERLFLLAALLVVTAGLWQALAAGPLGAREARASQALEAARARLEQINDSIDVAAAGANEGMASGRERVELLRRRVAESEGELAAYTGELVDPASMRAVLERLLREQQGLELVSARNIQVRPIRADEKVEEQAPEGATQLYRHGIVLVLEGSYRDCLDYLQRVEALPWRLYWSRLELTSEHYPRNRLEIELHTLSFEKDWIGV